MRKIFLFAAVLLVCSTAWSANPAQYCSSLLTIKEVEQICSRDGVKVNVRIKDKYMTSARMKFKCELNFTSPKTDVPTREGYLKITEYRLASPSTDWQTYGRPDKAAEYSMGDRGWTIRTSLFKNHTDSVGFQKGKHYVELNAQNDFCSMDQLKKISNMVIKRLKM